MFYLIADITGWYAH